MYDVVVVGLGIYGACITTLAGQKGLEVLAVDQAEIGHANGSSHGSSRIFRLTSLEDKSYASISRRAEALYGDQDREFGGNLLQKVPFALAVEANAGHHMAHGVTQLLRRATHVADSQGIRHTVLEGKQFASEYGGLDLRAGSRVFIEPDAAVIQPERMVRSFIERAQSYSNVTILFGARASKVRLDQDGTLAIEINGRIARARKLVLATGPYQHEAILGRNPVKAQVRPQVSLVDTTGIIGIRSRASTVYVRHKRPLIYSVPSVFGMGTKIGLEQTEKVIHAPDEKWARQAFLRTMTKSLLEEARDFFVSQPGPDDITPDICYYTSTSDSKHIVAKPAEWRERVIVVSCCSGHGFKYAPAIAESIVQTL